jgi:hypothetical protein
MGTNTAEFTKVNFFYNSTPLPESLASLKLLLKKAFNALLESRSEDKGFKGGSYTTSYAFAVDGLAIKHWHGDVETCYTLLVDDVKQFSSYDSWGRGHVEYNNNTSLEQIEANLNVILSACNITTDVKG